MEGLIAEGGELISEDADDHVRDAGLIGAAQRVEHYEIAGYGTARLSRNALVSEMWCGCSMRRSMKKELPTKKLTELAETTINVEAAELTAAE